MPTRYAARRPLRSVVLLLVVAWACLASSAWAAGGAHEDPVAGVALSLVVVLAAAKLGGAAAVAVGQPAVLGELLAGVALGSLDIVGLGGLGGIASDPSIDMLARLGVILLLFEVGLESTIGEMLSVGLSSLLVAVLGVVTPFLLGWGVGAWLLPGHSSYVHAFLGAALTATSVGITARVLDDLGRSRTPEARVILGAAVIDDVLGLVVLAVIGSVLAAADHGEAASLGSSLMILAKAVTFLFGALLLGVRVSPRLFRLASRLRVRGMLLATALCFCFGLAWLASVVGLAPIVGAYAAGLILEDVTFRAIPESGGVQRLQQHLEPISSFLVPVFFVLMGMRVELRTFAHPGVLGLAAALTAAAIIGKQACALGVVGRSIDRLSVGIGMIPRGEVGLIFVNVGLGLSVAGERVIDESTYSAIVIMVIVTTMITPPALKWCLARRDPVTSGAARREGRQPASQHPEAP